MSSTTTKLGLIKPADSEYPDIKDAVNDNMDILDSEVWMRGKSFNGETVGTDGGFHVNYIPYAGNFETSSGQKSEDDYIIRTTGGDASLEDGDAWLLMLRGRMRHDNFTPQSITMTVIPMERTADPDITATLNEETFEAYVGVAGTYTLTYTTEWSANPSDYGLTISNTPIAGDTIVIIWDGENDAELTVNAATRPVPESITATIDEDVFVTYVTQTGTTTLTYSTAWSADPTNYGITVTGTPIAGDVITVVYVKEIRGTIVQSNPQTFVSTGWNLYNHALGYARVIKYSSESRYGFKISGTYTALEFSTTTTGTRTTITPVSGYFTIPSDGYLFVTGGNNTNTQIWMTWSDWTSTANGGVFQAYSQDVVDLTTFMASNFPYGLMAVGTVYDEINLNIGVATSNVARMAYNATNLANAEASGMQYEYDENYIYIERSVPVTYSVSVDGGFSAYDHGMEYFTGTDQDVYAETMYGSNLKNKLERDVLTISQQNLTNAQKTQIHDNISVPAHIILLNADTAAQVYEKLNSLSDSGVATVFMGGTAVSNLTNGAYSGYAASGTVAKIASSTYRFNLLFATGESLQINQTNVSSSSFGTSEISVYTKYLKFISTDTTATFYAKLNTLSTGNTAAVYLDATAMSNITNAKIAASAYGTVGKYSSSDFRFVLNSANDLIALKQSGVSTSSFGTSSINSFNEHIQNISTDNGITSLTNIPVNTQGRIKIAASISPIPDYSLTVSYSCIGDSSNRILRVSHAQSGLEWINEYYSSTWRGWHMTIASNQYQEIEKSSSKSFTIPSGVVTLLVTWKGTYAAVKSLHFVLASASEIITSTIVAGPNINITSSGNTITVGNTHTSQSAYVKFIYLHRSLNNITQVVS